MEKYLKNSKNSYLWASKEKKKMDLSLNEVLWTILGSLLSSFKGFARVLNLLYLLEFIASTCQVLSFFEFLFLDFMRQ